MPCPSLQAMEALPYSNMVIREAMRLYPPVWVISRKTIEADTLAGFTVPPGTDVFFSPYFVHRHPDFWSDAEKFMPERFARSDDDERPKLTYLPFSAGAHHCIGETPGHLRDAGASQPLCPAASACAASTTTRWSSKP